MHSNYLPQFSENNYLMSVKLILVSLSILIVSAIAFGCKSQKDKSQDGSDAAGLALSDDVAMIFGSSGGFAGKTTKYKLYEDGRLYKGLDRDGYEELKPLDENLAGQFFSNFNTLGFDRMELNDPGNMTYFIIVEVGDRKKKLAWGGMNKDMPDNLDTYYRNFMKTMKRHNLGVDM